MKLDIPSEARCMQSLWTTLGYHSKLYRVLFQDGYWKSGEDVFEHLALIAPPGKTTTWDALDLGCGVGRQTFKLGTKVSTVVGADISKSFLKLARRYKTLKGASQRVFKRVNGVSLKNLGDFDFVYSYDTFRFFRFEEYICKYITEAFKLLRRKGIALLSIQTKDERTQVQDFRDGASLQPESWERLIDILHPTRADVILTDGPYTWFLLEK